MADRPNVAPPIPLPVGLMSLGDLRSQLNPEELAKLPAVPVPSLQQAAASIGQDVSPEMQAKYDAAAKTPAVSRTVHVRDLKPEDQAAVSAMLTEAAESLKQLETPPTTTPSPTVPMQTNVDILETPTPPTVPALPTVKPENILERCPHCLWKLSEKDPVVLTAADKEMFTRHTLGGDRFIKRYPLENGKLLIELRSRNMLEEDLVLQQCNLDIDHKRIERAEYYSRMMRYTLACSLSAIIYNPGTPKEQPLKFPEVVKFEHARGESAKEIRGWLQEKAKVESTGLNDVGIYADELFRTWSTTLYGSAYACCQHFLSVLQKLQDESRASDFFNLRGAPA